MLPVDKVTTQCATTSTGTAEFTDAGLLTTHLMSDVDTFTQIAYIEVHANSTDKSIGIFNITTPAAAAVSVTIPISALMNITNSVDTEKFTIRPIHSVVSVVAFPSTALVKFIDNHSINFEIYKTFFYVRDRYVLLPRIITPNGMDLEVFEAFGGGVGSRSIVRDPNAPNPVVCSPGSVQIQKLPLIEIEGAEYENGVQTNATLLSNRHEAGASYTEQEAKCTYLDEEARWESHLAMMHQSGLTS
ncbi:MAG: hypothetical protein EB828_02630 [Nitrosopumilus sp. D6]|nr:MAG: hypothetical protein EB828_02630 [Nitrosopumilus sp. D6]